MAEEAEEAEPLPPAEYDGPWKDALEIGLGLFLARFLPDVHQAVDWRQEHELLDQELQRLVPHGAENVRRVDRLVKLLKVTGDPVYLHVEVQAFHDPEFGARLLTYRRRIRERYGLPAVTVVIFADDDPDWRPTRHEEGQFGSFDVCTFRTVKLLEWADDLPRLEADENVFCLFAAAHLEAMTTRWSAPARQRAKGRLLRNLIARDLEEPDGQAWYRLIDWLLRLPERLDREVHEEIWRERKEGTVKYISFAEREGMRRGMDKGLEQGLEKGREQGLEKGLERGRVEGVLNTLRKVLHARFQADGVALVESLGPQADLARLDALAEVAATASLDELRAIAAGPTTNGAH